MQKMYEKRIFIQHLPEKTTIPDIEAAFSQFGKVLAVDVKERKDYNQNNQSRCFAYVNIEIDDKNLHKCFQDFAKNLWHGEYVELKVAAESFLQRLQRERQEFAPSAPTYIQPTDGTDYSIKNVEVSSKSCKRNSSSPKKEISDNIHLKSKHEILNDKMEHINKKTTNNTTSKPHTTVLTQSELKRISSVNHMIKGYHQQKSAIKLALSKVDNRINKKIVFNEDLELDENTTETITENHRNNSLFEGDEDAEEDINFNVKSQFEDKRGQQLFVLQSRFKNDKRFMLDERFIDDNNLADIKEHEATDISVELERNNQIKILEQILGNKASQRKHTSAPDNNTRMLRFDPTQSEHLKYELSSAEASTKRKRKKSEQKVEQLKLENEKAVEPEVSKNMFYKINEDLKETLKEKQDFRLLQFGKSEEKVNYEHEEVTVTSKKMQLRLDTNPFQYDSSDENSGELKTENSAETNLEKNDRNQSTSSKLWSESFFFRTDDYRLQEGADFMKRIASERNSEFNQIRKNVKDIIKTKIRNNQRKKKPFRKKLGGVKRKKIRSINKAIKK